MKKGLNDREKFCLVGYSVTHDADMAYTLARGGQKNASDNSLHRMALRWVRSSQAQDYLKEISATGFQSMSEQQETNRDKTDIVHELNILANQTHEPKLRAEILMRLADLQRMKDEPTEQEDTPKIHYHLPLRYPTSCKDCLLHLNGVKSIKEAHDRMVEDEALKTHRKVTLHECWGKKPKDTI